MYGGGIGFYTSILFLEDFMNTRNNGKLKALMIVLKSRKYVVDVIDFKHDIIHIKIKKI